MWWLRFVICIGFIVLLILYVQYRSTLVPFKNSIDLLPSVLNATTQTQNIDITARSKNVESPCPCRDKEALILGKCSEATFISARAKKRIEENPNAVFRDGDRVINLGQNYFVSVDDILYGYDVLFEVDNLFTAGSWLGAQFQSSPHDAIVFQQLIWKIKPDLIIDLGTNVGGSALFFASIMSFYTDVGVVLTVDRKPFTENWIGKDRVICKDCVNPSENKLWKKYVQFILGSTTDAHVIEKVKQYVLNSTTVFISHDASHDRGVVYQDLLNYAQFVSLNSYVVVQDTKLDRITNSVHGPLAAVRNFIQHQKKKENNVTYSFVVDRSVEVFYYSQHAYGWLKRVK